jgi:hypothetical protein
MTADQTPDVRLFSFTHRGGTYHQTVIDVGRKVEVTTSPTGRSVHVWVDGVKWEPTDDR